ncbi:MAG: hypothetical protein N3D18_09145 [Roseococcus sp.]|nr:hypothetical protein [Roseococcus sp.]
MAPREDRPGLSRLDAEGRREALTPALSLPCRAGLATAAEPVPVLGPLLLAAAAVVHHGSWNSGRSG